MKHLARLLIPVLISLGLQPGVVRSQIVQIEAAPSSGLAAAVVAEPVPIGDMVSGGTSLQQEMVARALERYATAGLELPVLEVHLHSDPAECNGNRGSFSSGSTPWSITVCTEDELVYLHEIGHAWAEFNLSEAERSDYVARRDLESWNDPATAWGDRGSEDAANTLAWGLVDTPIVDMLPDGPIAERNEGFRILTGIDSPRISG